MMSSWMARWRDGESSRPAHLDQLISTSSSRPAHLDQLISTSSSRPSHETRLTTQSRRKTRDKSMTQAHQHTHSRHTHPVFQLVTHPSYILIITMSPHLESRSSHRPFGPSALRLRRPTVKPTTHTSDTDKSHTHAPLSATLS
jgi:hypothetical protein